MSRLRTNLPIIVILSLFLALGVLYSIVNPLFESPDEVWHYEYVRWLAEGHGLPRPEQVGDAPWHQEGSQPPLYYWVAAALTAPIPTNNAVEVIRYNPHAAMGQPDAFGNKNVIVHGRADAWPWRGVALAAHIARFFSLLLGAITVLSSYGAALAIFPGQHALAGLAAALVAFNPQFLFLSAAVNNDNLVIAASAASVWLLMRLLGSGSRKLQIANRQIIGREFCGSTDRRVNGPTTGQLVLLGALIGSAALAKLSGLALAGLAGLGLLILSRRHRSFRALVRWALVVGGTALLVAAWWYIRNWRLYGDPLALQAMFDILPRRAAPPTLAELLARGQGVWRSAWAVFGWFNVTADAWLYRVYTILSLIGLAGLLIVWPARIVRRRIVGARGQESENGGQDVRKASPTHPSSPAGSPCHRVTLSPGHPASLLLLVIWIAVIVLALLNWAQMRYPQGRLLFPALSAAAVLLSYGLTRWVPQRFHAALAAAVATGMLVLAALVPWRWIAPAYAGPEPLAPDTTVPNPVSAHFGEQIDLLGYTLEETEMRPGDTLHLTLYWRATSPIPVDYSVFVHLSDEVEIVQAQQDSYPGAGSLPTSQWSAGLIIPDRHAVQIPLTVPTPERLKVKVGLYDLTTGVRLMVGDYDHWTIGYVTLLPLAGDNGLPNPVSINFDDQIALIGFEFDRRVMAPGDTLELTLWWEALATPKLDYMVFTHLVLPPDAVWAGSDQMPQAGAAPTSAWQPAQRIEDHYALTLPLEAPPGVYFVEIGLYDPVTHDRLMVDFSDKGIVLGQVRVNVP